MSALAYVESGSGSDLVFWVFAVIGVLIAAGAKWLAERSGRNGWPYFFLTLLVLPLGVVMTAVAVIRKPARAGGR